LAIGDGEKAVKPIETNNGDVSTVEPPSDFAKLQAKAHELAVTGKHAAASKLNAEKTPVKNEKKAATAKLRPAENQSVEKPQGESEFAKMRAKAKAMEAAGKMAAERAHSPMRSTIRPSVTCKESTFDKPRAKEISSDSTSQKIASFSSGKTFANQKTTPDEDKVNGEESAFAKLRAKAQSLGETPKVPLPRILANDKSSLFLQMRAKAQGLELVKKVQQKELLPAIELKAKMKNDSIFSQLQAKAQAFEQTENKKSLFKRSVSNELK
jgi:hypothetical protein